MDTPLNASANTAGALMSNSVFEVPPFQREYSWLEDEVSEFWSDLSNAPTKQAYFLGLIILTKENKKKQVVDGQQRILTLTLLASALYHEAKKAGRSALAERIEADFLRSIDYETDVTNPRVVLSNYNDNQTLQSILEHGSTNIKGISNDEQSLSRRLSKAYEYIIENLRRDLAIDPFKKLGEWANFITHHIYFAVFVHPDPASAYRVFEVINTRGRELTTADLLKNYVLSQTTQVEKDGRYQKWQDIANSFPSSSGSSFVQYIRHVVTVEAGHILPKDLFDFLAKRLRHTTKEPPSVPDLMRKLENNLPLYLQMIDPTLDGPAEEEVLPIFMAFNSLNVMSIRPLLLAMSTADDPLNGMQAILRIVVRRIVVGNLGTGNVERRFSEAAKQVHQSGSWRAALDELEDLNPGSTEFREQLRKRSLNKNVLTFLRRSLVQQNISPNAVGFLHYIRPRHAPDWEGFNEEDIAYWGATIGNTVLTELDRRPKGANTWPGFKENVLPYTIEGEWFNTLSEIDSWNSTSVENMGNKLAEALSDVWYV